MSQYPYQVVLFDLDGTLLNTLDDLADSMAWILNQHGYPVHTRETICSFVGNGIRKLVQRACPPDLSDEQLQRLYLDFLAYYEEHATIKTTPYPGIVKVLELCREKSIKTAIVSNKDDKAVQRVVSVYFPDLIDIAIGESQKTPRKPDPTGVNAVLRQLRVTNERAVYIGDSDVDIATAHNANLPCISVTWGFRDREFLHKHGATNLVDNWQELALLLGLI